MGGASCVPGDQATKLVPLSRTATRPNVDDKLTDNLPHEPDTLSEMEAYRELEMYRIVFLLCQCHFKRDSVTA